MKKALNVLLMITFVVTLLVPLTGVVVHKMASLLFLLLCLVHTALHWRALNARRGAVLGLVLASFLTGLFGLIWEEIPMVLGLHKAISIAVVFFLAIHIFVFACRRCPGSRKKQTVKGG